MIRQSEIEALFQALPTHQRVNLGVGDLRRRGWYRAQVIEHDVLSGRLSLTCFMDRPTDRHLEPGERVVVAARRLDDEFQSAPMDVEGFSGGREALVDLRMAGAWQSEDERRQHARVPLRLTPTRSRRWIGGAWRDVSATVVDLSSRGIGVRLGTAVKMGERLSLALPFDDGEADLRLTFEIRHIHDADAVGGYRAGGLFRNLPAADHERVLRFIFGELRSRLGAL